MLKYYGKLYVFYHYRSSRQATRNIYTENLRHAISSDTYVLRGDLIQEIYEPTYDHSCFDQHSPIFFRFDLT